MQRLIDEALKVRSLAYTPYSKFKVGAAIELKNGEIVAGCNVENAAYGLTICAERNALTTLIAKGFNKNDVLRMIIIADTPSFTSPCGSCRQVMDELLGSEVEIILMNLKGDKLVTNMKELLPYSFTSDDL